MAMTLPPPPAPKNLGGLQSSRVSDFFMHGFLEKFTTTTAIPGFKKRYVCLSASELSYYTDATESSWGLVPLDERGVVPGPLIVSVEKGKEGREFVVAVTNFENNRYPGRNHQRKDAHISKSYRFRAQSADDRDDWIEGILKLKNGAAYAVSPPPTPPWKKKQEKVFKTNLGRLMGAGDDWDEEIVMGMEELVALRNKELNEPKNSRMRVNFDKFEGNNTNNVNNLDNVNNDGPPTINQATTTLQKDTRERHETFASSSETKGGGCCIVS